MNEKYNIVVFIVFKNVVFIELVTFVLFTCSEISHAIFETFYIDPAYRPKWTGLLNLPWD